MSTASGSQTGFHNAPVTKGLLICIGGCSLASYLLDIRSSFPLQLTHNELWRLITSHSILTTSGEFFFGSIVMYNLRVIERQFGSSKYAAFFFVSSALSTILEVGALAIGKRFGVTFIPAGPYGFIFATLYQYNRIIPFTYQYRAFGYMYCLGVIPFLYFQYPSSIIAGICGLLAGAIYRSGFLKLNKLRFPKIISRFVSRFILPLLSTPPPRRSSSLAVDHHAQAIQQERVMRRHAPAQAPSQHITSQQSINEESIANLRDMFPQSSQETITLALLSSDNDINRAIQFLLDNS
ncbi:9144_t:CDS:2 [Funneliformis geosporum]|uniref:1103_t:CDS:1 n=1 Tax=Funneliformis geosporum TaxID=1117311 RepID=A0A9W4SJK6_9GLOM|nr:9144_t:CDS:2 [Funneliformis geosporum]CAI2172281.1 1103_t:CDS:2 [Funneliformis geosporum]